MVPLSNLQKIKLMCLSFNKNDASRLWLMKANRCDFFYCNIFWNKELLNKRPGPCKVFPKHFWRTSFFLFKQAVEIRDVVKTATVRNFCNGVSGINQYPGSMAKPYFIQAVNKWNTCALFNKPAEWYLRHVYQLSHIF